MVNWKTLSKAWHKDFLPSPSTAEFAAPIKNAIERTLPLLKEDPSAVPFVCRYRADVVDPLTTKQVHQLSEYIKKHDSLSSLRKKILEHLKNSKDNASTILRVETSISKTELEDIYAPFKPPAKGSLEDRIREEHPRLVELVDDLWNNKGRLGDSNKRTSFQPKDKAVTLLANRIAGDVGVMDAVMDYCTEQCKIQVKEASGSKNKANDKGKKGAGKESSYQTYHNFENKVRFLRDHQVLAIRRGVDQKMLKTSFEMDNDRVERIIKGVLSKDHNLTPLYRDAIQDAWTRLVRKRCTSRLWKEQSKKAEDRSIDVFCDNLYKALLAPPAVLASHQKAILSMDPGLFFFN